MMAFSEICGSYNTQYSIIATDDLITKKTKNIRKRKHIPHSQRSAEFVRHRNSRERKRVQSINEAFESLKNCLPNVSEDSKLSKADILSSAIGYIQNLDNMLIESENVAASANACAGTRISGRRGYGLQMVNSAELQRQNENNRHNSNGNKQINNNFNCKIVNQNENPFMEIVEPRWSWGPNLYRGFVEENIEPSLDVLLNIQSFNYQT